MTPERFRAPVQDRSFHFGNRIIAAVFAALALPLCIVLATLTPPGQVADEPAHMLRVAALLHGQIIGHRKVEVWPDGVERLGAGVEADAAVLAAGRPVPLQIGDTDPSRRTKLDRDTIDQAHQVAWTGTLTYFQISPIAIYMPAFYVPAAVGMGTAKLLGASPFHAIIAARLASAVTYVMLGTLALLLARRGRTVMFCVLSVPMSLSLAASCNHDGLIIATSVLAAALLTRTQPGGRWDARWGVYGAAAIMIAAIAAVKPPYMPLAAMLLLPLPSPRLWWRERGVLLHRLAVVVLTLLPAAVWTWFAMRYVSAPVPRDPYHPGPLWPGDPSVLFASPDPAAQLAVLRADPMRLISLPWHTLIHDPWIIPSAIGVLGWLSVLLPWFLYTMWRMAAIAACIGDAAARRGEAGMPRVSETVLLLAAAALCIVGIYLSQYLVWTNVGEPRIEGPQGRYWLPVLGMAALAIPRFPLPASGLWRGVCTLPAIAAAFTGMIVVPGVIMAYFYLR